MAAAAATTTVDALDPPTDMDISGYAYLLPTSFKYNKYGNNKQCNSWCGSFTYQMLSPFINNGPSNSFAGLVAGDYMFQVTDSNGCNVKNCIRWRHVWRLPRTVSMDITVLVAEAAQ
jgi:hypothetical protein